MDNKKKILTLILVTIAILLNQKISYAYKNINLFEKMIEASQGEIIENGIRTRFKSNRNGQELAKYFINKINSSYNTKAKSYINKENYYIDFEEESIKGTITITCSKRKNIVTIDIIQKCNNNELDIIKNKVKLISAPVSDGDESYYEYLRAKLPNKNLKSVNKELISILKKNGAVNISSIELNNGFSNCAYTGKYTPKVNNGKLMDLNFALSSYTSGKYLIIGTPEIIIAY
ncbi:hypothetical protein [Clostridium sp.]|jgi:hypothetical protein|uniref:hypothetical protein n=1 Tax=Clostridium sp. TaxID=1506 RepID=UPI0039F63918